MASQQSSPEKTEATFLARWRWAGDVVSMVILMAMIARPHFSDWLKGFLAALLLGVVFDLGREVYRRFARGA